MQRKLQINVNNDNWENIKLEFYIFPDLPDVTTMRKVDINKDSDVVPLWLYREINNCRNIQELWELMGSIKLSNFVNEIKIVHFNGEPFKQTSDDFNVLQYMELVGITERRLASEAENKHRCTML